MGRVTLTGHIVVPESDLSAVLEELPAHIASTRAEEGCLAFDVHQDPHSKLRFNVRETFKDQGAFRAHQSRLRQTRWGAVTVNVERHYIVEGLDD